MKSYRSPLIPKGKGSNPKEYSNDLSRYDADGELPNVSQYITIWNKKYSPKNNFCFGLRKKNIRIGVKLLFLMKHAGIIL